jgi:uncharacterized membrane protein
LIAVPRSAQIAKRRRHLPWPVAGHSRLLIGSAAGMVAALLPMPLGPILRAVIGWDVGVAVFLALILAMAARATPEAMQRRATIEDETRWVFLVLMAGAAWFSMFALLGPLHDARGAGRGVSLALTLLAGATVVLSWLFAHIVFAVHYAHQFYGDRAAHGPPGLLFPGERGDPDYWDFLYFSFVVGMTCQVSDVQVATQRWRRLVLAHGVLSFLFNAVVLALCINLLAGLL